MIQFLIISIVFFFLGRYSRSFSQIGKEQTIDDIVNKAKRAVTAKKGGAIHLKSPEEFESEKNGDKALEKHWVTSGIAKLIQGEK